MSRPAPAELFAALAGAMREHRWRWYVFGAQAVIAYGRPRLTADVDATVELTGEGPSELIEALAGHGFELRFPLSAEHLRDARLLPMVHAPTEMPLDLVIAAPGLEVWRLGTQPTDLLSRRFDGDHRGGQRSAGPDRRRRRPRRGRMCGLCLRELGGQVDLTREVPDGIGGGYPGNGVGAASTEAGCLARDRSDGRCEAD